MKNVLSFRIGPSTSPPYWLRMYFGFGLAARLSKNVDALKSVLRLNSYSTPWNRFVPDFCIALTSAPDAWPYCALMLLVSTVNSDTDSIGGVTFQEPSLKLSLLSAPFSILVVPDSRAPPAAALKFIP